VGSKAAAWPLNKKGKAARARRTPAAAMKGHTGIGVGGFLPTAADGDSSLLSDWLWLSLTLSLMLLLRLNVFERFGDTVSELSAGVLVCTVPGVLEAGEFKASD